MSTQRLFDRFDINTRISSGIIQIYSAREHSSGRDALVHEFPADAQGWKPEEFADKAKARMAELEPGIDAVLFADADVSDDRRRAMVVLWAAKVESATESPKTETPAPTPAPDPFAGVTPAAPPNAGPAEPGEFTRLFSPPKPAARHIQTAEPISLAGKTPPQEVIRQTPPPTAKPMEEHEFTRTFGTPAQPQATTRPMAAMHTPLPTEPPKDEVRNILELFSGGPQPPATQPSKPAEAKPAAQGFTQAFGMPPSTPIGEAASAPHPPTMQPTPSKPEPGGEFTRTFGTAPATPIGEGHAAPGKPAADPFSQIVKSPPKKPGDPGAYTQLFKEPKLSGPDPALMGPGYRKPQPTPPTQKASPPEPPKPAPSPATPGEFTQMFQAGHSPTPSPDVKPPSASPFANSSSDPHGEFTKMFQNARTGAPTPSPLAPPASSSPFERASSDAPGELTKLFSMRPMPAPQTPPQDPFAAFGTPPPAGSPESLTQILSRAAQTPPKGTPSLTPASPSPSPFNASPVGGGATHIFNQPTAPTPATPAPPSGPGEYTRIIAGGQVPPPPQGVPPAPTPPQSAVPGALAGAMPQVSGPQFSGPQFSGPQVAGPQFGAPSMQAPSVQAPYVQPPSVQGPYMQAPQVAAPTFQAPPAAVPTPAAPEKKGMSAYMPLIVILNVLVILAIVLVAYFALRHH
ncbi:MAG TPA: hypothetical protein VGL89_08580 [Candidatus Koribacter sp.]|jgi:hypothetical protein